MTRSKMHEPYRSFYLFLELLHMKEEYNDNKVPQIKLYLYNNTQFPDIHNSPIKTSLNKLERYNIIKYDNNVSDFDVEIIGDLDTLLTNIKREHLLRLSNISGDLELSLDEIYSKPLLAEDVFYAFFDNLYDTTYHPKERNVTIKVHNKKEEIEDEESVNTGEELNEVEFETSIGRQLAKIFY